MTATLIATEHVVLLDPVGRPTGWLAKADAHSARTPLHLAFSCHIVDGAGRVLLTRRAATKRTWPATWTNGCCGHPQLGETLREAVRRRLGEELGLAPRRLAVALPDFTYRAAMADGTVEHERCPVLVVEVDGSPTPDPTEVDDLAWVAWDDLVGAGAPLPGALSPWAAAQVAELASLPTTPLAWLGTAAARRAQALLDLPIEVGGVIDPQPARRPPVGALAAVADPLRRLLDAYLAQKSSGVSAIDPALGEVTDEIRSLVAAGGKRLRPAFVHWGHRATGAVAEPEVLRPAAAVELLHTFALLHDDVMDRSDDRRGRPAAHVGLRDRHRGEERMGDADWFGTSAAILAGDLTFVWADELFESTDLPPDALARARRVFTTLREEVIAGQYLDLLLAADPGADEARARHVALLKSARYTVTRPLLLGAALAPGGQTAEVTEALTGYGDAVGLAFQLRDDILGLYGDPTATGKSDLDDLHEGKRTLLMLRALRLASPSQRAVLEGALGNPALDARGADEVRTVVAATGALASVEALLVAQHAAALEALEPLVDPARSALAELADLAIRRHR